MEKKCIACNGNGQNQVYDSKHIESCETCEGLGYIESAELLHISKVSPKTARNLLQSDLEPDPYHEAIWQSARYMVNIGNGHWEYVTQYASGTCCWSSPDQRHKLMVNEEMARGNHVKAF